MFSESFLFSIRLSFQVASLAVLLVVILGLPLAYIFARKAFVGRELLDMICTLPLVLPPTVIGYYLIVLFGRNGLIGNLIYEWIGWTIMFTWYAAVLASAVVSFPLLVKTSRAAIESVDKNLINASYTLGHSELSTIIKIILPLAKQGILAGVVLAFARAMGEFGATLMIAGHLPGRTDTMSIEIYSHYSSGELQQVHFMIFIMTLISGIFIYLANKYSKKPYDRI